jgi:transposase InsO family protein
MQATAEREVLAIAHRNPRWSAANISGSINRRGIRMDVAAVQGILDRAGLGTEPQRSANTERMFLEGRLLLSPADISMLEFWNPCLRDRSRLPSQPGQWIDMDLIAARPVHGGGTAYLQIAVDVFSGYAFVRPFTSEWPSHVAELLDYDVLPEYVARGIQVKMVSTDSRKLYCGNESHPFEAYLARAGISHSTTKSPRTPRSGYLLRFKTAMEDEFLRPLSKNGSAASWSEFQVALHKWVLAYNTVRPHNGFPNWGTPPAGRLNEYPFLR